MSKNQNKQNILEYYLDNSHMMNLLECRKIHNWNKLNCQNSHHSQLDNYCKLHYSSSQFRNSNKRNYYNWNMDLNIPDRCHLLQQRNPQHNLNRSQKHYKPDNCRLNTDGMSLLRDRILLHKKYSWCLIDRPHSFKHKVDRC